MSAADVVNRGNQSKRGPSGLGGFEYYTLRDVKQLLLRRKWMMVCITLTAGILVSTFAYVMPNQYQASTLIMVDPGKVPDSYVKPTATIDAKQRLAILQEEILSDTRLGQVIDELGLYHSLKAKKAQGDIVDMMRSKIDVESQTTAAPARALKTVTVSFTAQSPMIAAKVSNRLASLFIEENLKVREQQVVGTADFFQGQLEKAKQDLDEKSQKLAQLRARYSTELPESQNLHLQALTSAQMSLREETDAIARAEQQKAYLQALLGNSPKVVTPDSTGSAAGTGLQEQLEQLQTDMDQMRTRYGPSYPDVLNKAAAIESIKKKINDQKQSASDPSTSRSTNARSRDPALEGQIAQIDEELRKHETRQADLASRIKFHEAVLQRVPAAQEELTAATNDVAAASDRYKRLEDRKFGADMFSDVEARQQGERFVLLDPAQPPERPAAPNRLLIDGIGTAAGLVLALALVALLELLSPTVKTEREVRERLGVPVFGEIPRITTASERRQRRVWTVLTASGNLVLAVAYFGVLAASLKK